MKAITISVYFAASLAGSPGKASAAEGGCREYPCLELEYGFWLLGESLVSSNERGRRMHRLYIDEGELKAGLSFNPWLSVQAMVRSEPVRAPRVGRNSVFFGQAVLLEELYVNLDMGAVEAFAGKFNPTFGYAWNHELTPGIYAKTFAEEYRTVEMLGFGMRLKGDWREHGWGHHHLTGQVFFQDNTFLHTSLLSRPRFGQSTAERVSNTDRSQGGIANTGRLNNYSVTLDGGAFDALPALNYHLGYRRLHRGVIETRSENAYAIAFDYDVTIGEVLGLPSLRLSPLVELVHFENFEGNPGKANVWSAGTKITHGPWILSPAFGIRRIYGVPDTPDATDRFYTVTFDYRIDERWTLGVGYQRLSTFDVDAGKQVKDNIVALRLMLHGYTAWSLR